MQSQHEFDQDGKSLTCHGLLIPVCSHLPAGTKPLVPVTRAPRRITSHSGSKTDSIFAVHLPREDHMTRQATALGLENPESSSLMLASIKSRLAAPLAKPPR